MTTTHKADVLAQIKKQGWTIKAIAEHYEVSPSAIRVALEKPNKLNEERIAVAIGITAAKIWPERYEKTEKSAKAKKPPPELMRREAHRPRMVAQLAVAA